MTENEAPAYQRAGVDLHAADEVVRRLKPLAASTATAAVKSTLGSFGGFFAFPAADGDQFLVASIDGVGTKMKVARLTGRWEDAGYDIVAHGVDDILTHGARPLFFLDYIGTSRLEVDVIEALGRGMAAACREASCALLGGETAEMPGVYAAGEVDLVGAIVGVVDRGHLLPGARVRAGDRLIGLRSNGLHTNGYTLARRVLIEEGAGVGARLPGEEGTVGDALCARHRMYLPAVRPYLEDGALHAMAHITGGGIPGNLGRVIPEGLCARVDGRRWEVPAIFREIQRCGGISTGEMYRVFNMGIGWILVADPKVAAHWTRALQPEWGATEIGEVSPGPDRVAWVV